ncbi:Beta-1,4-N-acetylgalactosaminyltransferase bre-4 [Aphelenchoides bicaudatus]|nr:Beta-1,4-N-acetylgalactosaminyltransferase bre-4 [Aphelenchoides bicaudatus]
MWKRSWTVSIALLICLIYVIGLLQDEQFIQTYTWLPQRLSNDYDDPIFLVLNSTEAPLNSSLDFSNFTLYSPVFHSQPSNLSVCPTEPPNLVGPIRVWLDTPSFEKIHSLYPNLEDGGHGQPNDCLARHKVAVVVPYRDRETHLRVFLHNLHAVLQKQQLDYAIVIVEQIANQTFNRAKLMNVGFAEANKLYNWNCYVFHDVDLLPEDDRNVYSCPEQPRHHSVAVDKFAYKLPYGGIFGGVSAMTRQQYVKMNGFSNDYWGWGGEDISTRVSLAGYKISRYPIKIARYKMIRHNHENESNPVNKCRYKLMRLTKLRYRHDGLSNLNYKVKSVDRLPTHTRILVDLLEKGVERGFEQRTSLQTVLIRHTYRFLFS